MLSPHGMTASTLQLKGDTRADLHAAFLAFGSVSEQLSGAFDALRAQLRAELSEAHAGKFEHAQGGTLLLDEISEMELGLQAKILRVLQEREVERLGSSRTISLDVRLIATSNRDLPEEVRVGRFRADLYYPPPCESRWRVPRQAPSAKRYIIQPDAAAAAEVESMDPERSEPVVVPHADLGADLLRAVIESFVLREGTDYGEKEVPLDQKVERVIRQLERGEAHIVFDPDTESVNIAAGRRPAT